MDELALVQRQHRVGGNFDHHLGSVGESDNRLDGTPLIPRQKKDRADDEHRPQQDAEEGIKMREEIP